MKETPLSSLIALAIGKLTQTRVFRNNTGTGWVGRITSRSNGYLTIEDPRPLHAGLCVGSSDRIGWTSVTITPDMIGKKVAVFTAIEVKGERTRISPEQLNFIAQVQKAGGIAGIARSPQDAIDIITGFKP